MFKTNPSTMALGFPRSVSLDSKPKEVGRLPFPQEVGLMEMDEPAGALERVSRCERFGGFGLCQPVVRGPPLKGDSPFFPKKGRPKGSQTHPQAI